MKGVGGHQPVNLAPTANDRKTQDTNKVEGGFGRFKVSLPKTIKQFLSSIFSAKTGYVNIHSRDTKPHTPTPQQPPSDAGNNNNSGNVSESFDKALVKAKDNPRIQQAFADVSDTLEALQTYKNDLHHLRRGTHEFRICSHEITMIKKNYQEAVSNFNTASPDLKIDSSKFEMAMANKHSSEFAQDYSQYKEMKKTLLKPQQP